MLGLGRNQLIVIIGGLLVLAIGFAGVMLMPADRWQAFLDFVGAFSWKVITAAVAGSALIKSAGLIKNGQKPQG